MPLSGIRYTVLEAVNQVQQQLGLDQTSLTANKVSRELVEHINTTVNDISDFGNWMEQMVSANIPVSASVRDYFFASSAVIKNVGDIFVTNRVGPLNPINVQDMRVRIRTTARGTPTQFTLYGTDSNANPILRVDPIPDTSMTGAMLSVLYWEKPPLYTTSDSSTVIPFPGDLVVLGAVASYLLRESGGSPTPQYQVYYQKFIEGRREALNRFNSDTGWDVKFRPSYYGRRR